MSACDPQLLSPVPVLPILVVDDEDSAEPLAEALVSGGVTVFEVTLRTASALKVVTRMRKAFPSAVIGVGSVRTATHMEQAIDAGAQFLVTPGATVGLLEQLAACSVPVVPGVVTPSELMTAQAIGFQLLKFFPAEAMGGVATLKALAGPFPDVRFCPTGGIEADRVPAYLAVPTVVCVGGGWITPPALVKGKDWAAIRQLALRASSFR